MLFFDACVRSVCGTRYVLCILDSPIYQSISPVFPDNQDHFGIFFPKLCKRIIFQLVTLRTNSYFMQKLEDCYYCDWFKEIFEVI